MDGGAISGDSFNPCSFLVPSCCLPHSNSVSNLHRALDEIAKSHMATILRTPSALHRRCLSLAYRVIRLAQLEREHPHSVSLLCTVEPAGWYMYRLHVPDQGQVHQA